MSYKIGLFLYIFVYPLSAVFVLTETAEKALEMKVMMSYMIEIDAKNRRKKV